MISYIKLKSLLKNEEYHVAYGLYVVAADDDEECGIEVAVKGDSQYSERINVVAA
jgi:hypothetical protein